MVSLAIYLQKVSIFYWTYHAIILYTKQRVFVQFYTTKYHPIRRMLNVYPEYRG